MFTNSWRFLRSVTPLCGWGLPFLGGDQPFLVSEFFLSSAEPICVCTGVPKNGLSPPIVGMPHPQRVATVLEISTKM